MKVAGKTIDCSLLRSPVQGLNRQAVNTHLPQPREIPGRRMRGYWWMATASRWLRLGMVVCCPSFLRARSASSQTETPAATTQTASELLTTLDHLVEQSRQLEKQNQELMNQINSLRQFLAKQSGLAIDAIPKETGAANPAVAATAPIHIEEANGFSGVLPKSSEHGDASSSASTQSFQNYRLNLQVINVYRSPVSSTFGFYTGGLKGVTFAIGATTLV